MPVLREETNGRYSRYISLNSIGANVDVFGNELKIGNLVAHSANGYGIVTRITNAGARIAEFSVLDLGKEYHIQDVAKEQRWRMPSWTCDKMAKCMSVKLEIVEVQPSQDFIVKYTLDSGFYFYAKFDVAYMGEIV